jgi:RNA polymerase sigma factor (sigma-70 family)
MRDPSEWVPRLQAGDDEAWEEFVRVFSRFVPIVSARLGLSAADREEVLQEMTLTALRSIRNLRDPTRLGSWTFTIARRAAINLWKSRRAMRTTDEGTPDLMHIPGNEPPIDEILARFDEMQRVRQAVSGLGENCRRLVEGLFFSVPRLSYKEISERYEMPIGSIGPTLARCLHNLRRIWKSVSK